MKLINPQLYFRLVIASFIGWAALRVAYRYWQFHPTPFSISGGLMMISFGLAAMSGLFLAAFFALCQWLVLRRSIKSILGWTVPQIAAWLVAGSVRTALILPLYRMFHNETIEDWIRASSEAAIVAVFITLVQYFALRKSIPGPGWWALFPLVGIFCGTIFERLNQHFVFIDPLTATLIASAIVAVVASLPALLIARGAPADVVRTPTLAAG